MLAHFYCIFHVGGYGVGIDDVELQTGLHSDSKPRAQVMKDGVLVHASVRGAPESDYNPAWLLYAHPSAFPHGVGQCPEGVKTLGPERWIRVILQRHPSTQYAQNLGLIADAFNILQRHRVSTSSWLTLRLTPGIAASIVNLSPEDIKNVTKVARSEVKGAALISIMQSLSTAAKTLLAGLKRAGQKVQGSPQAMLSVRSKVISATTVFGPYTCMINLNPSESGSQWTFALAGKPYTFMACGRPKMASADDPDGRPNVFEALKLVAANPVACADAIHAIISAFSAIFLGWPMDAKKQQNSSCLFGEIHMLYFKYESSGRGSKHMHGQITQPALQVDRLMKLMGEGNAMQARMYNFMESFSMSYIPDPSIGLHAYAGELNRMFMFMFQHRYINVTCRHITCPSQVSSMCSRLLQHSCA
jgi:hypothetical protein